MKIFLKKYLFSCLLFFILVILASAINPLLSKYPETPLTASVFDPSSIPDADIASGFAWSDSVGWINFGEGTERTQSRVYVSNNQLYGYAWGENIGWISLNCENDDSCDTTSYGVSQTNSDGQLTGYAWGKNIGWIDFAPTGGGVIMTTNTSAPNTFSGYAWGENIGWISFNDSGDQGVTTTWTKSSGGRPTVTTTCGYSYSEWATCVDEIQTRTVAPDPIDCDNEPEPLSQSCVVATTTPPIIEPIAITINPASATIFVGENLQFSAIITGTTTNNQASWSIIPVETIIDSFYGTINNTGLYTSPNQAVNITVQAKANADISKIATANLIVRLRPVATTTLPIATTTLPIATTTEPIATTTLPIATTTEPIATTTLPISTTTEPVGTTTEPIATEPELPISTTTNPVILGIISEQILANIQKIFDDKTSSIVTEAITTIGLVGGGIAASSALIMNGTTAIDLLFLPFRLWGLLLSVFGLKKKNEPWGTVYDSITKQPIDPAYVTLKKMGSENEMTSITDLDGRYGFLVTPGQYTLTANKTNYVFPSQKMFGKTSDVMYNNLYFGETIDVKTADALIDKNIPLDPIKFDWNEFVKGKKKLMKFYSRREKFIRILTDWIFRLGFVISIISLFFVPSPYNIVIFCLYIIMAAFRKFGIKQKALGRLIEKDGTPLSYALLRVFAPDLNIEFTTKVADQLGRYYCLIPSGTYYVQIEKKNDDESYSVVHKSEIFEAKNGLINKNFVISA